MSQYLLYYFGHQLGLRPTKKIKLTHCFGIWQQGFEQNVNTVLTRTCFIMCVYQTAESEFPGDIFDNFSTVKLVR